MASFRWCWGGAAFTFISFASTPCIAVPGSWELGAETPDRTLCSFNFRRGDKFVYEYDMTDYWKHEVRIEAWLEPQPRKRYPACIGGKGDCPPEECGGPVGYDECRIEALVLYAHEDLDTMV